jgi:hypothetical protein
MIGTVIAKGYDVLASLLESRLLQSKRSKTYKAGETEPVVPPETETSELSCIEA